MTTSSPPNARPDWNEPLTSPATDGDDVGWLITFSDLVLQLFAFVLVAAACGAAAPHAGARSQTTSAAAAPASADTPPPTVATAPPATVAAAPSTTVRAERSGTDVADAAPSAYAPADAWAGDAKDGEATAHRTTPAPPRSVADEASEVADERPSAAAVRPTGAVASTEVADPTDSVPTTEVADPSDSVPTTGVADSTGVTVSPRVAALARYLDAFVAARDDVDAATVSAGDRDVRLAFGGRLGFRTGSAELLPRGRGFLAEVQRIASAVPDLAIEVAGYTDDVPIHTREFPSNLELSLARAASVARELQRGDPALAVRTVALGFGEHHAIAPNDDAASRARNRRVEVRLVTRDHSMP